MSQRPRRRPAASTVISVCALVLASAGVAPAAARLIDGKTIKSGTIAGAKLKKGTITADRLAGGVLRGGATARRAVTASRVPAALPARPATRATRAIPARQGDPGAPGADGIGPAFRKGVGTGRARRERDGRGAPRRRRQRRRPAARPLLVPRDRDGLGERRRRDRLLPHLRLRRRPQRDRHGNGPRRPVGRRRRVVLEGLRRLDARRHGRASLLGRRCAVRVGLGRRGLGDPDDAGADLAVVALPVSAGARGAERRAMARDRGT